MQTQPHVRLAHGQLPQDPGAAFLSVDHAANNLTLRTAGRVRIGDNLAAWLAGTCADALYARVLFLFLDVPGVVLAVLFTLAVAASGAERRRREQGLLRTRGVSTAQVLRIAGAEAATIGAGGLITGLLLALMATLAWWRIGSFMAALPWLALAAAVGLAVAAAGILVPAWREARWSTVATAGTAPGRGTSPLWERLFVDVALLALASPESQNPGELV